MIDLPTAPSAHPQTRFFSVAARFSGRVVARASANGLVWAWRAARKGERPSPKCLFVPTRNAAHAAAVSACAAAKGYRVDVRPGHACAIYRSGPLAAAVPPLAVKIWLPPGLSASAARDQLRAAWLNLMRP